VGRKRPRSARPANPAGHRGPPNGPHPFRSAKAVSGVMKRLVPRSSRAEPRLCEAPTRRKPRKRTPGTREVRVHAVSFRWQKSIGRIVRLAPREAKSLVEDAKASRALAGRKLEAPSDAGHEPRKGESVRGTSALIQTLAHGLASGFRLTCSRDDGRRPRILTRVAFTGSVKSGSFDSRVNRQWRFARIEHGERIGRQRGRIGRA